MLRFFGSNIGISRDFQAYLFLVHLPLIFQKGSGCENGTLSKLTGVFLPEALL